MWSVVRRAQNGLSPESVAPKICTKGCVYSHPVRKAIEPYRGTPCKGLTSRNAEFISDVVRGNVTKIKQT